MSWNICFPGGKTLAQRGLALVLAAVSKYEDAPHDVNSVVPLTDENNLILIVLRQGNACQKGAVDHLAGYPIPGGNGYLLVCRQHPFFEKRQMILISSETEDGLWRGCSFFVEKYLPHAANALSPDVLSNPFQEGFPEGVYPSANL